MTVPRAFFDPFFDADLVAVQTGLTSNYGEFAIIKIWVEYRFPDAKELNGVSVTEPVGDKKLAVLGPDHVRQGDEVAFGAGDNRHRSSLDFEGESFGFAHNFRQRAWILNPSNSRGLILSNSTGLERCSFGFMA